MGLDSRKSQIGGTPHSARKAFRLTCRAMQEDQILSPGGSSQHTPAIPNESAQRVPVVTGRPRRVEVRNPG